MIWHSAGKEEVAKELDSQPKKGLTDLNAGVRRSAYAEQNRKEAETAIFEERSVREFLKHYWEYAPLGGVLRAQDKIVGLSAGEIVGDTLIIHVEKADTSFSGAYQMLVNEYAKHFVTEDVKYINREEDTGDEGIRQSKESYHPLMLLEKYVVTVE